MALRVAVGHGVLTQLLMVDPLRELAAPRLSAPIRRLVPVILQFSTFNWFVSGIALIICAYAAEREARMVAGVLAGSSYLFGALGNLWGTRGRHPGWALYAVALALIAYGLSKPV